MTEILEILPLSQVRAWAISRSFMSGTDEPNLRACELAPQQDRGHGNHVPRRFPRAAAGRRTIGIQRFDLVADPDRLTEVLGEAGDANANLVGLVAVRGKFRSVQGIDADEFKA